MVLKDSIRALKMRRFQRQESSKSLSHYPLTDAVKITVSKPKEGWKRLKKVIKSHPDMNERDETGFTAILHAARLNLPGIILKLAEAGANVNLRSNDGNTPFHYACFREHWLAMSMLVRLGADPNAVDTNGRTPLIRAIECQDEKLIVNLLELGASPHVCGESDITPLFAALSLAWAMPTHTSTSIVLRLLDAGSDVNETNKDGNSPLTCVCLQHRLNIELIELLLQRGAMVNVQDAYGRTPLSHCLRTNTSCASHDCLSLLLRAGADTNLVDDDGHTCLSIWAQDVNTTLTYGHGTGRDHNKTLRQLLACGADPNIVTGITNANSLMHTLASHERYNEACLILSAGAEPAILTKKCHKWTIPRSSPLITALLHGNITLARLLSDGLFYTQTEIEFLSQFFCSKDTNSTEYSPGNNKHHPGSFMKRLIKSSSRSDIYDLYDSYCKYSMSALSLEKEAPVRTHPFRRTASVDTLLNTKSSPPNKFHSGRELSTVVSNECLSDINGNSETHLGKRSHAKRLDLGMMASVFQVEPEQLQNLGTPQARELIEEICHNVPSLQRLCRRNIHRSLQPGRDRTEAVRHLAISPRLQKYILFQLPVKQGL